MTSCTTRHQSHVQSVDTRARLTLMASLETAINNILLLDHKEFNKSDDLETEVDLIVDTLDKINSRFEMFHNMVNDASDGLDTRVKTSVDHTKENAERVELLKKENKQLRFELEIIKNVIFKQDADIDAVRNKVTDLTACSMKDNITISSILNDTGNAKEDCKAKVIDFIKKKWKWKWMRIKYTWPTDWVNMTVKLGI